MKEESIKYAKKTLDREGQVREDVRDAVARKKEKEERGILMDERYAVHVNLISVEEMKAHTKEMRSEMDRKFVECLIAQGLSKLEALKQVREWSVRWDSERNGN